jgi:hypothetical protein
MLQKGGNIDEEVSHRIKARWLKWHQVFGVLCDPCSVFRRRPCTPPTSSSPTPPPPSASSSPMSSAPCHPPDPELQPPDPSSPSRCRLHRRVFPLFFHSHDVQGAYGSLKRTLHSFFVFTPFRFSGLVFYYYCLFSFFRFGFLSPSVFPLLCRPCFVPVFFCSCGFISSQLA